MPGTGIDGDVHVCPVFGGGANPGEGFRRAGMVFVPPMQLDGRVTGMGNFVQIGFDVRAMKGKSRVAAQSRRPQKRKGAAKT